MSKKIARLIFALSLLTISSVCLSARTLPSPRSAAASETDRDRDGLQGPVRRIRTETAKLVYKGGKLVEDERKVLETATYDMKGAKIDNAYFLAAGGALTGREVYKYDDRGNIVEMTLFNADGSVVSKEKYDYEFDAMGNWTKMVTSVAVVENGQMKFEPTEVTYRFISYFLEETVAKKLQSGQQPAVVPAPVSAAPAPVNSARAHGGAAPSNVDAGAKTAAKAGAKANAAAASAQPQQKPAQKLAAPPPAALIKASSANVALIAPERVPTGMVAAGATAPVVRVEDDLPPPPKKAPVRPLSGGVLNGKAISLPPPAYPETAKRVRASGTVVVEVVVDVNGRVISAKAISGPALLREVSERAALQAKFTPALLSGQPVKVSGLINYNFTF